MDICDVFQGLTRQRCKQALSRQTLDLEEWGWEEEEEQ
jgi:hypothetical protein